MVKKYFAFGLKICSDLALPELPEHKSDAGFNQVNIATSNRHNWPPIKASEHSTQTVQMDAGDWRLSLEGIGWFRVHQGCSIDWQRWDDSVSDRDLRTFLVSSALGALLIQRGNLMLEGTALVRGGKAVLLLGPPTSGKSTLAWCLHEQGWELLSSELSLIDSQGRVWPGMQQLKLWHDATVALELDWEQMPLVRKGLERYAYFPSDLSKASEPIPLAVIYGLTRRRKDDGDDDKEDDAAAIYAWPVIRQQVAMLQLRNQAFQPRFYRGMEQEQELFLRAAALIRHVGLHRLLLPDDIKMMQRALAEVNLLDPLSLAPKQSQMESTKEVESPLKEQSTEGQ